MADLQKLAEQYRSVLLFRLPCLSTSLAPALMSVARCGHRTSSKQAAQVVSERENGKEVNRMLKVRAPPARSLLFFTREDH